MPQLQEFLSREIVTLSGYQVTVGTVVIAAIVFWAYRKYA